MVEAISWLHLADSIFSKVEANATITYHSLSSFSFPHLLRSLFSHHRHHHCSLWESTSLPVFRVFACHYIMTVKRKKKPQQRPTIWFRFPFFYTISRMLVFLLLFLHRVSSHFETLAMNDCKRYVLSPCVSSFYFKIISSCHFPSYRVITV